MAAGPDPGNEAEGRFASHAPPSGERIMEDNCKIENRMYVDGAEVCGERRCFECKDGKWEQIFVDLEYARP